MRKKYIVTIDTDEWCPHSNKEILMHINDLGGGNNVVRIEDWEDLEAVRRLMTADDD